MVMILAEILLCYQERDVMPSYKYECACGQVWDVIHSIHDDPEFFCDHCGGVMERKISGIAAVQFQGPGFYSTDKDA